MAVVTCPKCQAKYDPGIEQDLDDLPDSVSMKVVCPACGQWVRLPGLEMVDTPNVPANVLEGMKAQSRLVGTDDEPKPRRRADDEDDRPRRRRDSDSDRRRVDDDDRPRRRNSWDDEDDDRPVRRRRRHIDEIEDDYRDGPRPRRGQGDGLGKAAMIVGIVSIAITLLTGLLSCVCVFGIVGVILGVIGGIVAVILGFVARARTPGSGPGLTGILTGFGSIALALLLIILAVLGFGLLMMNQPPGGGPGGGPGMQRNNF